jgi:hypothetical protein
VCGRLLEKIIDRGFCGQKKESEDIYTTIIGYKHKKTAEIRRFQRLKIGSGDRI